MSQRRLFTSESVTEGHPDKICDVISDSILDALLEQDSKARVAIETLITVDQVHIVGEITTSAYVNIPKVARNCILKIGYDSPKKGLDGLSCGVNVAIGTQSPDIAQGVDNINYQAGCRSLANSISTQGAGDQGIMFGYATDEITEFMPISTILAHQLAMQLTEVRKNGVISYLYPDGKTQVTIQYKGRVPISLDTIVISTQHADEVDLYDDLTVDIKNKVVDTVLRNLNHPTLDTSNFRLIINPTGKFILGGPMSDAGLTGRKIIVDTYGGWARHGGGSFSGKDPSKVDRSAAYATRWIAKNIVAAGLAKCIEVQVAYAIGKSTPVSLFIETFGTETTDLGKIEKAIKTVFDLRPGSIIQDLNLLRPIYTQTASYGHFGRTDISLPWESINKIDELKSFI